MLSLRITEMSFGYTDKSTAVEIVAKGLKSSFPLLLTTAKGVVGEVLNMINNKESSGI